MTENQPHDRDAGAPDRDHEFQVPIVSEVDPGTRCTQRQERAETTAPVARPETADTGEARTGDRT